MRETWLRAMLIVHRLIPVLNLAEAIPTDTLHRPMGRVVRHWLMRHRPGCPKAEVLASDR